MVNKSLLFNIYLRDLRLEITVKFLQNVRECFLRHCLVSLKVNAIKTKIIHKILKAPAMIAIIKPINNLTNIVYYCTEIIKILLTFTCRLKNFFIADRILITLGSNLTIGCISLQNHFVYFAQ